MCPTTGIVLRRSRRRPVTRKREGWPLLPHKRTEAQHRHQPADAHPKIAVAGLSLSRRALRRSTDGTGDRLLSTQKSPDPIGSRAERRG